MFASSITFVSGEASSGNFVDLNVTAYWWIGLSIALLVMLAVDLIRHREDHAPTTREAAIESAGWVTCGLLFGVLMWVAFGTQAFGEYISGYLIEKSLSVDNVFVWSMLFTSMAIPVKFQHRVLFWGIFGALALRLGFILLGSTLLHRFEFLLVVFGVFLIFTGIKVLRHKDDEDEEVSSTGLSIFRRFIPFTDEFDGHKFFTVQNAKRVATPLFAALVVVEFTDLIFALDSVPAVLAVSKEPFIVFASNAFAILGLRAMYFLLADAKERFHYLSHALGAILIFVGLKMTVSLWFHLNTFVSLGIIIAALVAAIVFSERKNRMGDAHDHAHHH